jgi:flagellar biosynthesis protein FlhB
MPDKSQRTETATQRRLEKAREEGQFPAAKELVAAAQFTAFVALLGAGGAEWFAGLRQSTREVWTLAFTTELTGARVTSLGWRLAIRHLLPLVLCGLAMALATVSFRLVTTRFGFSLKKLAPDLSRLNGFKRLADLPQQNFAAVVEAVILLPVFLWAVYVIARDRLELFLSLPLVATEGGVRVVAASVQELFWKAAGVFIVFGCVDLFRQLRRYGDDLKMSKQEIKEEAKEGEGNPEMKARIRRLQRDRLRRNMMQQVPTATAVIVNPTHYAVAIRYQMETMTAPVVVAKGKNYLALRIRQKAIEHQVPIIENRPLAQALYKTADVGQEIPAHLYRAVAEILAYIFKLMNGRMPG